MKKPFNTLMANAARDIASRDLDHIVTRYPFRSWHIGVANALADSLVALCSALNDKNHQDAAQYASELINIALAKLQRKKRKKRTKAQPQSPSPGRVHRKSP